MPIHTTSGLEPAFPTPCSSNLTDHHGNGDAIPDAISTSGVVLGVFLIATGVFGNVLVILSVMLNKHLCKAANIFIISLAVCDIFQNIMVKPLYVHTYIRGRWVFGRGVCIYALFSSNLAILESILHVTSIAFFRYLVILHPRVGRRIASWRAVSLILIAIYVGPVALTVLPALPKAMHKPVQFNERIMFCSFVQHAHFRPWGVVKKVLFLSTAALIILYSYIRIYYKSRQRFNALPNSPDSTNSTHAHQNHSLARVRNDLALLRTVKIIFVAFVLCYLPLSVLYAVDTSRSFPYWSYFIAVMLLWSSSSINWVIYFCVNRRFRKAYKNILCGLRVPSLRSDEARTTGRSAERRPPLPPRVSVHVNGTGSKARSGRVESSGTRASFSEMELQNGLHFRSKPRETDPGSQSVIRCSRDL